MRRRVVINVGPDGGTEDLKSLGFTGYEARVYMALLHKYPATAYEVSKQTGLARANVYDTLERLTTKVAVQPVNENPVRYVPIDPHSLLDRIARRTASRCSELADKLTATKPAEAIEFVWTLTGDDHIHAKVSDMIDNANEHIWVKTAHDMLAQHIAGLKAAAERGVKVLIILFGEAAQLSLYEFGPTAKVYLHESSGIHVGISEQLLTLTADFKEALTATLGTDGHGVFTRSRPVVNIVESLIRHELYLAEIFMHYGKELDKAFGPSLLLLRQKYLPDDQVAMLKRALKKNGKRLQRKATRSDTGKGT